MPVKIHQDAPLSSPSHGWCIIWTAYQSGVASETYPMAPGEDLSWLPGAPDSQHHEPDQQAHRPRGTRGRDQTAEQQPHRGEAHRQVAEDRDDTQKRRRRIES
jgi:hypothetical protein